MNWEPIIRHYKLQHRPYTQKELNWFRRQSSLEAAIIMAAKAEDDRGLRYSHQCRITQKALQEANRLLLDSHDRLQQCKSFHELWSLIRRILEIVDGLGELYIYDTAFRIGAYLNLLPDRVYLHAGTRSGAKAYGILKKQKEWLKIDELPHTLREMLAYEVEDILCIYKDKAVSAKGCT